MSTIVPPTTPTQVPAAPEPGTPRHLTIPRMAELRERFSYLPEWERNNWACQEHDRLMKRAPIPASLRRAVYERDGSACVECGTTEHLSLDHVVPWSLCGPDTLENLRTLCRSCNSRKGARA